MANELSFSTDLFRDLAQQLKLPALDLNAIRDIHSKNIEAIGQSFRTIAESGKAISAKQQDILAAIFRDIQTAIADYKPDGNPQDIAAKQTEFARRSFDAAVTNLHDVAELLHKSSAEAPKIILDRMRDSFVEIKAVLEKR